MNKNCITCESFAWWDGDYCCIEQMKIFCNSPKGEMNENILVALEKNKNCNKWRQGNKFTIEVNEDAYNDFMKKRNGDTSST